MASSAPTQPGTDVPADGLGASPMALQASDSSHSTDGVRDRSLYVPATDLSSPSHPLKPLPRTFSHAPSLSCCHCVSEGQFRLQQGETPKRPTESREESGISEARTCPLCA